MITRRLWQSFGKLARTAPFLPKTEADKKSEEPEAGKPALIDQHPKGLDDTNKRIFNTEKVFYLTKPTEVDIRFYSRPDLRKQAPDMIANQKLIKVAFVGMPNAGKSSLVNKLTKTQVSAVSKISYTTWENTVGVKSDINSGVQTLYVDTPGIVDRYNENKEQVNEAWKAVDEADMVAFVIDGAKKPEEAVFQILKRIKEKNQTQEYLGSKKLDLIAAGLGDQAQNLSYARRQLILIINKLDLINSRRKIVALKDELEDTVHFEKVFLVSSETGFGLQSLSEYIDSCATEMKWEYSLDVKTEKSEVEMVEEFARETIFKKFFLDVPYKIDIKTTQMAVRSDGLLNVTLQLKAFERNKVPILMGTKGRNMKWMKAELEAKLADRYGLKSNVTLVVSESRFKLEEAIRFRGDLLDDKKGAWQQELQEFDVKKRETIFNLDRREAKRMIDRQQQSLHSLKSGAALSEQLGGMVTKKRASKLVQK